MLPKKIRLTTGLFDQVFKTGRMTHGNSFWMRSVVLPADSPSRFAVAVSKKVAKTAVLRNKTKRIVYQAIGTLYADLPDLRSGQMAIFGVKTDISKLSLAEITQELKDLLLKKAQK